jgi:hypothetical protein
LALDAEDFLNLILNIMGFAGGLDKVVLELLEFGTLSGDWKGLV